MPIPTKFNPDTYTYEPYPSLEGAIILEDSTLFLDFNTKALFILFVLIFICLIISNKYKHSDKTKS